MPGQGWEKWLKLENLGLWYGLGAWSLSWGQWGGGDNHTYEAVRAGQGQRDTLGDS